MVAQRDFVRWLWVFLFLLFTPGTSSAAEQAVAWERLKNLASQYLKACCTPQDVSARQAKFRARVEQRMKDQEILSEDTVMRTLMLDWAQNNNREFFTGQKDAVAQACLFLVEFLERGYLLPEQIRSRLTPDVVEAISGYLEARIAAAGTTASSKQQQ